MLLGETEPTLGFVFTSSSSALASLAVQLEQRGNERDAEEITGAWWRAAYMIRSRTETFRFLCPCFERHAGENYVRSFSSLLPVV